MIDVTCPQCGLVYHSEESHIGKHLRCSRCGVQVPILRADRAVVPQSRFPKLERRKVGQPSVKQARRRPHSIYGLAITFVLVTAAIAALTLLRRPPVVSKVPITRPVAANPVQPDQNFENTDQWEIVDSRPIAAPSKQGIVNPQKLVPPVDPRPTKYNSLPTGTTIAEGICTAGHGKLKVDNGTNEDAVVRLSDAGDKTLCWFFVKAKDSAEKTQIPEGTYRLAFTSGLNWIESEDTFSWHASYSEFERPFEYREQADAEGIQYHDIEVTLNPVPSGNIRTRQISREEFLKGHHHSVLR